MAAVGAKTSRIEVGTAVIDMRYENPFYMAEDAGAPISSPPTAAARHQVRFQPQQPGRFATWVWDSARASFAAQQGRGTLRMPPTACRRRSRLGRLKPKCAILTHCSGILC